MNTQTIIALLLFFFSITTNAQNDPLEETIIKIITELKDNYEYVNYGKDYAKALGENKPIPKPTFSMGEENKLLKDVMNSIQRSLDEFDHNFEVKFPENNSYPEDLKGRTQSHKLMFESLTILVDANDKCINYYTQLEEASRYIVEIKKITNELQKIFTETFNRTGQGYTELSRIYGFEVLKMETFTKPQLSKIHSSLKKLLEKVQKEKETVLQKKAALAANMEIWLKNHKSNLVDSLKYAMSQQKKLEGKAKFYSAKLKLNTNKINLRHERLSDLRAEKEALIKLKGMIDENESNATIYKNQLSSKQSQHKYLSYCPNNKSWEQCTHTVNKRQYTTNKQNIENEIHTLTNKITLAENYVREISPKYAHRANKYNNSLDNERDMLRILQSKKKELDNTAAEIATDYLKQTSLVYKYQQLTIQCETDLVLLYNY